MPRPEAEISMSLSKALMIVEALVQADTFTNVRRATEAAFGGSPEYKLVVVLANAERALPLKETRVRCGAGRRAVLRDGRLRLAVERLTKSGTVVNLGLPERPRYQLNLIDAKAKTLIVLFSDRERHAELARSQHVRRSSNHDAPLPSS